MHGGGEQVGQSGGQAHAQEDGLRQVEPLQRGDVAGCGGDVDERDVTSDLRHEVRVLQAGRIDYRIHVG